MTTYVTSPAWKGKARLTAGEFYPSSGNYHGAWDLALELWTPLYAVADGTIGDLYTTAANNSPGYNPGSGSPSNWRLLHTWMRGERVTVFYQHLSPGSAGVARGQYVRKGQLIGYSGNSGNSSGRHLHLAVIRGWVYGWNRYANLTNRSLTVYPPSRVWESPWASGAVYLSRLRFGVRNSDSVKRLQYRLRAKYPRYAKRLKLRINGNYDSATDMLVRRHQRLAGWRWGQMRVDAVGASSVGPKQAAHIFGSAYRVMK
jgi:murein DD-endopeptidase MepM/ murein hydrolase activator NlpD